MKRKFALRLSNAVILRNIYFQITASNATQVVIKNVSFGLSGNFTCEVTADSTSFSTATAAAQMMVVGELRIT
jgi:hypothetical protein